MLRVMCLRCDEVDSVLAIHLPRNEWPDGYKIIPTPEPREVNRFTKVLDDKVVPEEVL